MGRTYYLQGGKAVIRLSADDIFTADTAFGNFEEIWSTLLHEM